MEKDRHIHASVGLGEVQRLLALGSLENGVDDIGLTRLHAPLCQRPVHGLQFDMDAGAQLPKSPLVLQHTLEFTLGIAKDVGRVVVVQDNGDGAQRWRLAQGQHWHAKQNTCENQPENQDL